MHLTRHTDRLMFMKMGYVVNRRHVDYAYMIEHEVNLCGAWAGARQTVKNLMIHISYLVMPNDLS